MFDVFRAEQIPLLPQQFDNRLVRLKHLHSGEMRHVGVEFALMVNRRVNVHAVFDAGVVVFLPMPRRGMHAARALLERHVLRENALRGAVNKRMAAFQPLQRRARKFRQHGRMLPAEPGNQAFQQGVRDDEHLSAHFDCRVGEFRVKRDAEVGGQRPRRCRPDHDEHRLSGEFRRNRGRIRREPKADEN